MPKNQLTKEEIKMFVLKLKGDLLNEDVTWTSDPKAIAHKYLNKVLDRIEEFRY